MLRSAYIRVSALILIPAAGAGTDLLFSLRAFGVL